MKGIGRILVPTDFGEVSARALAYALGLAMPLKAEVHLLHVMTQPVATPPVRRVTLRKAGDSWRLRT